MFVTLAHATSSTSANAATISENIVNVAWFSGMRVASESRRTRNGAASDPGGKRWWSQASNQARACGSEASARSRPMTKSEADSASRHGSGIAKARAMERGAQKLTVSSPGSAEPGRRTPAT